MDPIQVYPSQSQLHDTEHRSAAADHHHDDEVPAVKRILHQFYLVKLHPYEDQELESAIKRAQGVISRISKSRAPVVEDFEFRKMDRDKLNWHRRYRHRSRQFVEWPWDRNYKTRHLDFLQASLRKLTFDEDLEKQVKELQRRLVHDQRPSQARERKIIKDLDALLRMKELVDRPSQAEENAKIIQQWGSKEEIRQRIQRMHTTNSKVEDRELVECLEKQHRIVEKDLQSFEKKLLDINKEKAKAHECILDSTRLQATIRADYEEYVAASKSTKELAMKKDILGLQELINRVNERFMSKWNNEKALFRQVYKKRVAFSLDSRGFDGDGMLKSVGDQRNNGVFRILSKGVI